MTTVGRPALRGVSHQFAFFGAIVAGVVLVSMTRTSYAASVTAVYAITLAAMFGISAAYHRGAWGPRARTWWRRADHATIFIFIAGTYTPICLLGIGGEAGARLLVLVWTGAALGVLRALLWVHAPPLIAAVLYVAFGWLLVAYWTELSAALGIGRSALFLAGGVLYTIGATIYALRRPDPAPRVFGYHEIFHALVIGASVCHLAAIATLV